ncbi:MAG: DUF3306 domain-containing protein [Burkholderiales bacterium]
MAGESRDGGDRGGAFLHRWSRRKHEAARGIESPAQAPVEGAPKSAPVPAPVPAPIVAATPAPAQAAEPLPLPPVESLTLESDFTPFLSKKVDETVKRAALRKLFSDPHFNVMDGLDVYIDDYSKPDPMPPGFLDKLADVYKTLEEKTAQATDPQATDPSADATADATVAANAAESPPAEDGRDDPRPPQAGTSSLSDERRG